MRLILITYGGGVLMKRIKAFFSSELGLLLVKYTLLFFLCSTFIGGIFSRYGKEFIWGVDGIGQHVINLRYFRSMLINFFKTGHLSFFTWKIGVGFDLYSNYAYYILGDFFSYLAVLFPTKSIEVLYGILIFIRLYAVGLSFIAYCHFKKRETFSTLIGALMYVFCIFSFYSGFRHPYFLNPLILLPLLLMGIEKVILENKITFYIIILAFTYIVNFYFAYSLSIIIGIYGIILTIWKYYSQGLKKVIQVLLKVLMYSLIGIMISGVVLIPTLMAFFNSERVGTNVVYPYDFNYYRLFLSRILTSDNLGYSTILSGQSLIVIILPLAIRRWRQNKAIMFTMLILIIPLLWSLAGSLMAGFSFPNNRWSYVFLFFLAYLTTEILTSKIKLDCKDYYFIAGGLLIFFGWNFLFGVGLSYYVEMQLVLAIVFLLIIIYQKQLKKWWQFLFLITYVFNIVYSINKAFDIETMGVTTPTGFIDQNSLTNKLNTNNEAIADYSEALKYIKNNDNGFYRISKYPYGEYNENFSLMKNYNSISHYLSITPQVYSNLNVDLKNFDYYLSYGFRDFNYRTKITTLLGIKYLIHDKSNVLLPYGYNKTDYKGPSFVYQNQYALPFGVLYTNYINEEEFNNLSSLEKESSLLKTTMLMEKPKTIELIEQNNLNFKISEVNYEIIDENKIINDSKINITNAKKNTFKIKIEPLDNKELYVGFDNLNFDAYSKKEIINLNIKNDLVNQAKVKNSYRWYQKDNGYDLKIEYNKTNQYRYIRDYRNSPYYMNIFDFLVNLGFYNQANDEIMISLSKIGNYSFDNLKVYAVGYDDYEDDIKKLQKSNFQVLEVNDGYLKGKTNTLEDGILQFQTLYNKGFKVFVDGKQVETLISNKYFLGIELTKGSHEIILKYRNPNLKKGLMISTFGIMFLIGLIVYRRKMVKNDD